MAAGQRVWGMVVDSSSRGVMISLPQEIAPETKVDITITIRRKTDHGIETILRAGMVV